MLGWVRLQRIEPLSEVDLSSAVNVDRVRQPFCMIPRITLARSRQCITNTNQQVTDVVPVVLPAAPVALHACMDQAFQRSEQRACC